MTSRFVKRTEHSSVKKTSVFDATEELTQIKNDERGASVIYNPKRYLPLRDQRKSLPIFSYCMFYESINCYASLCVTVVHFRS
jgi:hypothetical protein